MPAASPDPQPRSPPAGPQAPTTHPLVAWTFALVPFVTLAGVLRQLPDGPGSAAMPWSHAAWHSTVLLGLMGAHAACYALWVKAAPNRMLVNEFLTRIWFVLFGLVVVGVHVDTGGLYFVMASGLAVASWCTHYLVLRARKGYGVLDNVAQLGLFLVGVALSILVALRFAA